MSGESAGIVVEHTPTIASQSSWMGSAVLTGNNLSLTGGASWGHKTTSAGTRFTTPTHVSRTDHVHEEDTRAGITISAGFNPSGVFERRDISFQKGDHKFIMDSQLVTPWTESSSCNAGTFDALSGMLDKTRSITMGATNIFSVASLAGCDTQRAQSTLDDIDRGLSIAQASTSTIQPLISLVE